VVGMWGNGNVVVLVVGFAKGMSMVEHVGMRLVSVGDRYLGMGVIVVVVRLFGSGGGGWGCGVFIIRTRHIAHSSHCN
jgi:hypothetical protein